MKTIGIVLALSNLALAFDWDGLRVTWKSQAEDPKRNTSLFVIPRTRDEAVSAGWVEVPDADSPKVTVHCIRDDYRFCVLLDGYGNVAGFQAAVSVNDLAPMQTIYNLSNIGEYEIKTIFSEEVWTTTIYTVDPETIEAGGRCEIDGLTGTEGIWIKIKNGYLPIPRNVEDLDPIWLKQACVNEMAGTFSIWKSCDTNLKFVYLNAQTSAVASNGAAWCKSPKWAPLMYRFKIGCLEFCFTFMCSLDRVNQNHMSGTHYYYNMSTSFPCEKTVPWFLLYQDGELNGCGFEGFGSASIKSRQWWEVLGIPITYIIPDSPQCLTDWIADYGLIFMHVFFVQEPWKFSCGS